MEEELKDYLKRVEQLNKEMKKLVRKESKELEMKTHWGGHHQAVFNLEDAVSSIKDVIFYLRFAKEFETGERKVP